MVTVGLVLAACGSDDAKTSGSTATTTASAATTGGTEGTTAEGTTGGTTAEGTTGDTTAATTGDTEDPTGGSAAITAPAGEPDTDANFIYGYPIGVSRLDPHQASISQDATTLFPAYDRLVDLTADGELVPSLAESWEFSDDLLTLTLHIRPGVKFHDETDLDAAAVKTNLDRVKSLTGTSANTDLKTVDSITVTDPMTVVLKLNTPNVALIGALADRAGAMVSPKAIADGVNLDETMVGAGPFKFVSAVAGSSTKFERFDDYWDKDHMPKIKTLEIRVLADPVARLNAMTSGQIDATQLDPSQVADVQGNSDLNLFFHTELQYTYLVQNRSKNHQDDLKVRQALVYAIDRDGICQSILFGYCELSDQPFPPGYFANDGSMDQVLYPYDPETAKSLLAEAGVSDLHLSMVTPAGLPQYQAVAEAIQAEYADIGVTLDLTAAEPTQLGKIMFVDQQYDDMIAGWGGRTDPSITIQARGSSTGFANPGGVSTPTLDDLYAQSVATSGDARTAILQQASAEMAKSVLEIVIFFPKVPYVTKSNVSFVPYITSKPEFRDVYVTK